MTKLISHYRIATTMKHEKIQLPVRYASKGIHNNNFIPILTTYIIDNYGEIDINRVRPLVIVCPGGAYAWTSRREAEPVAIRMNALGFHACVLDYSVAPMDYPAALLDLCEAINYVREHAEEWHVDAKQIIVCGFSAAGHLAASLGILWNSGFIQKYIPLAAKQIQPNALCLCYPVITSGGFRHDGSIRNVLGSQADNPDMRDFVSLENQVNDDVPPVFMWHTNADESVPVENSLLFAIALRKHHIPLEYHMFLNGMHGISLASEETATKPAHIQKECSIWPDLFAGWVRTGIITQQK
mgnify:CR=1 FL=1